MIAEGHVGTHQIYMSLNYLCNDKCLMCGVPFKKHSKYSYGIEFYLSELEKFKHVLSPEDVIVLTGGEPLLFKEILVLIRRIRQLHPCKIRMLSNGRILHRENFLLTLMDAGLDSVTVHFLHYDEDLFCTLTGAKGSYSQTVKGLRNLNSSSLDFEIKLIPQKLNVDGLLNTYKFCRQNFPRAKIIVSGLQYFGEVLNHLPQVSIRYSEVAKVLERLFDYVEKVNDPPVRLYRFPLCTIDPIYWKYAVKTLSKEYLICPDFNDVELSERSKPNDHPEKCRSCTVGCNWYSNKYIELFGEDELTTF
jgi:MoaA/NifB/PqqE/SkfB family radical SAM enzyme